MIICNARILKDWSSTPFEGFLRIENGKIVEIGRKTDVCDFDLEGKLVIPGFFNTHTHAPMSLLKGISDDEPFDTWLFKKVLPVENKLTEEMIYWGTILAQMEMVKRGIVAFVDMYFKEEWVAQAVADFGMKAVLTRGLVGDERDDGGRLKENLALFEKWHESHGGRIKIGFGPHSPYLCTPRYLKKIFDVASFNDAIVTMHILETKKERKMYRLEDLLKLGMSKVKMIAVHCVYMEESEMKEARKTSSFYISHNPSSNLKLGNGVPKVHEMIENELIVSLGTDGSASNNSLDIWHEMRLATLIQKLRNPKFLPSKAAFKIATLNGAVAMGFERSGKVEEGFDADLVVVDTKKPHYYPEIDLISNLVHAGNSGDVFATMVNGKWLYYDGKFLTIEEEQVYKKVEEIKNRIFST